jgi:hypothetical protein
MTAITFPRPPGFADVSDAALAAENFASGVLMGRITENAAMGLVRPEVFVTTQRNGDTVALPVSPVDGYVYSRDELIYCWGINSTVDPGTGWASVNGMMWFAQWFVDQTTGKVTSEIWYSLNDAGTKNQKTNDGTLVVYTVGQRRKNSLFFKDGPAYYTDHADADFATDIAAKTSLLKDVSRNAKFGITTTEAFYMGTYKGGQQVGLPTSPIDGYKYTYGEITFQLSWVWTTNGDKFESPQTTNPTFPFSLAQLQRFTASIDASGNITTNVVYIDTAEFSFTTFGRLAVVAFCQRKGVQMGANQWLRLMGLCGAWTSGSGVVVQPVAIGSTRSLVCPPGASKLQLGIDDDLQGMGDNVSTTFFNVTATSRRGNWTGTVPANTAPWDNIPANAAYPLGPAFMNHAPIEIPLTFTPGDVVSIVATGTVTDGLGDSGPDGHAGVTGDYLSALGNVFPTKYMHELGAGGAFAPSNANSFAWVDSNQLAAGKPLRYDLLQQVNKNTRQACVTPEIFLSGNFTNGQTVPLPTGADGYVYTRAELTYIWEWNTTGANASGMIRLVALASWVDQNTGVVSITEAHLKTGQRVAWDNEGTLRVITIGRRSSVNPNPPAAIAAVSQSNGGGASSTNTNSSVANGGMDSFSSAGQTIADGWSKIDAAGNFVYSEQAGLNASGSSQGIAINTAGAGNSAGVRGSKLAVYPGERNQFRWKSKATVAITAGWIARLRFWNTDQSSSVYCDVQSGAHGTAIVVNDIGVQVPANGDTTVWTETNIALAITGTLNFQPAWVTMEFEVNAPNVTTRVDTDDADWVRSSTNLQGRQIATTDPSDKQVLAYDAGTKKWKPSPALINSVLFQHYADVGSVGVAETDLYSDSVPGATLGSDGSSLSARYAGTFFNSASTKRIRVYFAGTLIFDSGALTVTATADWDVSVMIIRESNTVARCTVSVNLTNASTGDFANYVRVTAIDFTTALILKITGTAAGGAAANNDVMASSGLVWMLAANPASGVLGTAIFKATGGVLANVKTSGIVTSVVRTAAGFYQINYNSIANIAVACNVSDDNVNAMSSYLAHTPDFSVASTNFTVVAFAIGVGVRDPGQICVIIFAA